MITISVLNMYFITYYNNDVSITDISQTVIQTQISPRAILEITKTVTFHNTAASCSNTTKLTNPLH